MSEKQPYRATILPVLDGTLRPLWSVMIPTYNCAHYLREALSSVLEQDPGANVMQIEVVDDHSTKDDPKTVVEELGKGRVNFYQQPQNVGYIKNFETCLQRSSGHLVHLLHGDDCVQNGFYQKMQQLFEKNQDIGAAFCRHLYIDAEGHWQSISPLEQHESGVLDNWLRKIISGVPIQSASMVVRREVYEQLGGFDRRFNCCYEDREMWVRIATKYPVGYLTDVSAAYRLMSTESLSKTRLRTGEYARDLVKGHKIIESNLAMECSEEVSQKILSQARETSAFYMLEFAKQMLDLADIKAALIQIQEALNCSSSLRVFKSTIKIKLRIVKFRIKNVLTTILQT